LGNDIILQRLIPIVLMLLIYPLFVHIALLTLGIDTD
jgi:hypothetical protein